MNKRVETGPLRFDEDLTGAFIRGDSCWSYANLIKQILETGEIMDYDIPVLEELLSLLQSPHKENLLMAPQVMKVFNQCLK